MTLLKPLLFSAVLALGATSAMAATTDITTSIVCEGGVAPAIPASSCQQTLGDFGTNPASDVLNISDSFGLFGGVANGAGANQWVDAWTMNFGSESYALVFNWQEKPLNSDFDGTITVGGTVFSFSTDTPGSTSIDLGVWTGDGIVFVINPIAGVFMPTETATWDLQVEAVPLPAGLPLLIAGLGALGLLRRRQSA